MHARHISALMGWDCQATYHILLTKPVELLELLGHEQLSTSYSTPDLSKNCETQDRSGPSQ